MYKLQVLTTSTFIAFYFFLSTFYSPMILGVSHMTVKVTDLTASRAFYGEFLGYDEVAVPGKSSVEGGRAFFRVSDRQYIELRAGLEQGRDRLDHISFQTDDAAGLRSYLLSRGIEASAIETLDEAVGRGFTVRDPEGHRVELVEYSRMRSERVGKSVAASDRRISSRILHLGIIIGDVPAAMRFYGDVLGLKEFWRGQGRNSETVSWINMRLPDGEDYVEFMLYAEKPAEDRRGSQHHICLEVDDIEAAKARLEANPYRKTYTRELQINTGVNRRRQLNLFDPDGTRIELMEPRTVDGVPPRSTTAPLPVVRISR